jgi:tetratricopeptide (TPR) repeat protein
MDLQPDYAAPHYGLGNVLIAQGKRPEAIAAYQEALRRQPDGAGAYNNLGLALAEERRLAEAVVILRQAVRLRPQAAEGHNNLGMVLAESAAGVGGRRGGGRQEADGLLLGRRAARVRHGAGQVQRRPGAPGGPAGL